MVEMLHMRAIDRARRMISVRDFMVKLYFSSSQTGAVM